jgi:DNA-binding SARP family transcriptional activator
MHISLLGGFALRRQDGLVELPHAAERLIAFLALEPRPVHRLFVAGVLWIDTNEERALASLRTTLWRIRRRGVDLVDAGGPTLRLTAGARVDVRDAIGRAHRLIECPEEHCPSDIGVLGAHGELLPDWYDDWIMIERERFRELRLRALESVCRAGTDVGSYGLAAEAGLAAIACEPLRESAHRALMAAYVAEGNEAEAMRHYELFRKLLGEAGGLVPSARMEMLVARLRTHANHRSGVV